MYPFGTWNPTPSATRVVPISSRKLSASILIVGCRSTNRASGPDAASMISTATMTAVAMTHSSFAIPTAVITLSSENTMSRTMICASTPPKLAAARAGSACVGLAFEPLVDLARALVEQKQPARDQDDVAPGERVIEQLEYRRRQSDDPGDRGEQREPGQHGQRQARAAAPNPAGSPAAGRPGSR